MSSIPEPNEQGDGLEAAVDQAIAVCGGDLRAAVRALIIANNLLESEVAELEKAVSHAYVTDAFGPTLDRCQDVGRCDETSG